MINITRQLRINAAADALNTTTNPVNVSNAAAPTAGKVLTATDATHATWQSPGGGGGVTVKDVIMFPTYNPNGNGGQTINSNSTLHLTKFNNLFTIVANIIYIQSLGVTTPGAVKVCMFSEDGQTQIFSATSGTIITNGTIPIALSAPTTITSGEYYIGILSIGTMNFGVYTITPNSFAIDVAGKPILNGTITVVPDTIPATINPLTITLDTGNGHGPLVRFCN